MSATIASVTSWSMLCGGIALLTLILLRRARRSRAKLAAESKLPLATTARANPVPLHDAPSDVLRWQVEMHEFARATQAEIDTKLVALQALIALAEAQARRLETLVEQAERFAPRDPAAGE